MHTALDNKLLPQTSSEALCESCHSKGQGADTAVMDGMYVGLNNSTLLGGGFNTVGGSNAVTGKHGILETGTPYGTATGTQYTLTCLSCHTPHDGPNYRLLKRYPGEATSEVYVTWNGPWQDASETAQGGDYRGYTESDLNGAGGVKEYTRNYKSGIAAWCTSCHTKYMQRGPEAYNPGDMYGGTARYRHGIDIPITGRMDPVNGVQYNLATDIPLEDLTGNGRTVDDEITCLSCHRAHGTDAVMTGSADLPASERGSLPAGKDGMLLRMNDRAICRDCHQMK